MRALFFILSVILFSCGPNVSSNTDKGDDLIDVVIGTYHGSFILDSQTKGVVCKARIEKISSEQIRISTIDCTGHGFELILDKHKSKPQNLIFRNRAGKTIARWMNGALSYQYPLDNGDVENYKGRIDQ